MLETTTPIQERAAAAEALEYAFSHRDYEGMEKAVEELSRASFEMGRAKGKYIPVREQKPKRKAEPETPHPGGEWTVHEVEGHLISFKNGSTVYTVVRPGGDPSQIVALCDNKKNAEMIAKALSEMKA